MEYAKLQGTFLRSVAFKDADMAARGAWVTLAGHCADQENGGRIVACQAWNDRQWLSRTDCMRGDVEHAVRSELARWDGADLVLVGYDVQSEAAFHNIAAVNRQRALDQWQKRRDADAAAAAKNAAGSAAGTDDASRRQNLSMPPAVPPAPAADAAGIENRCHLPTDLPTDLRNTDPAAVAAPAPPPMGAPSATATTSAKPTSPAPPAGGDDNAQLRVRLGRYGMAASPQATAEWAGLLRERAAITRWSEVNAFLAHCATVGRHAGKPIRFARDALAIADEWRSGVRPEVRP